VALGSSWNPDLAREVGQALGREAKALDVQVLLGPGINIKRSPLCGRNFEYLSEDPHIAGVIGAAIIQGMQSQGIGTSLKHFAANNQETDRLRVSADVDQRSLREIYLAGFERGVKEAAPTTLMASYNRINGVYATENRWLLTEVLREEWGFEGLVMSDWGAVNDRVDGVHAGLDLEMPGTATGAAVVAEAVRSGRLNEADLDAAARSVLRMVAATAKGISTSEPLVPEDLVVADHELARKVASQCAVLLKNENGVLPLARDASVAVIGEFARTPRYQGAGSSQIVTTRLDNALDELRTLSTGTITFAPGFRIGEAADAALVDEAVAAAANADVAVVFLGLAPSEESEGFDRTHIDLPAAQLELLEAVASASSHVVVVLSNGSVVKLSDWADKATAILEGWLLGQAGGGAIADLLYGVSNPSGRLAETIPLRLEDTSSYLDFPGAFGHVNYSEGVFVGYRWYDARDYSVSYPFGHGLSYTSFEYSDLDAIVRGVDEALEIDVTVTVTNSGSVAGREVVQLYVSAPSATVERPLRELRGFRSVDLDPGQSATVTLTLGWRDLAYYHPTENHWVVEPGTVGIEVGASSRDLRLKATVEAPITPAVVPLDNDSTIADWLAHPVGAQILAGMMALAGDLAGGLMSPETLQMVGSMPLKRIGAFPGVGLTPEILDGLLAQANA
jgi:beta-glucosidase